MSNKQRLMHYLKPMRNQLIVALVFAFIFVACQIAQPFLLGRSLDASKFGERDAFFLFVLIAFGFVIIGAVAAYIFEVIVNNTSQRIIKKARDEVFEKINAISVKDFSSKRLAILSN